MDLKTKDSDIKDRRICVNCIGEKYLRGAVETSGVEAECTYCAECSKTFSVSDMADRVETAIKEHYSTTLNFPDSFERAMLEESDHEWQREGDEVVFVIAEAAKIKEEPAEDIRLVLEDRHYDRERAEMGIEGPFDKEVHYVLKEADEFIFRAEWDYLEKSLNTEARLFNRFAHATLDKIFREDLPAHRTRDGAPVIVEAGKGKDLSAFFRARVFESDEKLKNAIMRPDIEVGPPPTLLATAGRMNAHGISVFYGATQPQTALAEIRPPVGSNVVVARFETIRDIRLLDVRGLKSILVDGSVFDRNYLERLDRAKFLEILSDRISRPVMPDDEPFEYVVTQAIADYLATGLNLDGILYPSVQANGGINVVLFHHAARVDPYVLPEGTEVSAHNDFGSENERDFCVFEEVPEEKPEPIQKPNAFSELFPLEEVLPDPALRLDFSSIQIHRVTAVKYTTDKSTVMRVRKSKQKAREGHAF